MQQATPFTQLVPEYPAYLQQETDTATPRKPIPIFYMHAGDVPFCANSSCFCQRGKQAGAMLYPEITAGKLLVAQVKTGNAIAPPVERASAILDETRQPECLSYGHSWELTESPDEKECSICHLRGYCPGCTLQPPAGAQPFSCTFHMQQRQVEQ